MKEQVTPAEYPEGYLLRAFTTCLILQLEISYVPTRSEQTANANLSMSQGPKPRKTNIAIYFNITCQMLFSVLHPHVSYGSHIWHKGSNPPPEGKLSFNVIFPPRGRRPDLTLKDNSRSARGALSLCRTKIV